MQRVCETAAETKALGRELGANLRAGDVVILDGPLGAGKTTFVRGACRALGVTARVTSPTFTIGHRYRGTVDVSHLDLYRLEDMEGEDPALLDDYLGPDGVAFVGLAPIEDFAYPLAGVLLLPALWTALRGRRSRTRAARTEEQA